MHDLSGADCKAVLDLVTSLVHAKSINAFAEMIGSSREMLGFESFSLIELSFNSTCSHRVIFSDTSLTDVLDGYVVPKEDFDSDEFFPAILEGREVLKFNSPPDYIKKLIALNNLPESAYSVATHVLSKMNRETMKADIICFDNIVPNIEGRFNTIAGYLHTHLMSTYVRIMSFSDEKVEKLSEREKSVLIWLKHGKTSWEVSRILEITENTVNFHIKNIKRKLNATNRQHAVAIAIAKGIIE